MATRKKTTARKAAKKTTPRKAAARKAPAKTAKKAAKKAVKKAPAKKATAARKTTAAKKTTKQAAVTKATGKTTARKAATKKAPSKVVAKKAGTVSGRTTAVKKATPGKSPAGSRASRPEATQRPNIRKATERPAGASGVTQEEKSQRRRAARTDARTTMEPADGVTTNFGRTTAATPRDTDRGTSRTRKAHRITPEEALANTRELLEAKQARDREPPPWRALDAEHGQPIREQATPARDMEQEAEANMSAEKLHRAESRLDANQGSVSQQDRHQQGRHDAKD
jgi:hypothetical protein